MLGKRNGISYCQKLGCVLLLISVGISVYSQGTLTNKEIIEKMKWRADSLRGSGNYEEAHRTLDDAIVLCEKGGGATSAQMGWLLVRKAYLYGQFQGRMLGARQYYVQASNLLKHFDSLDLLRVTYVDKPLANIYTRLGDYRYAIARLKSVIEVGLIHNEDFLVKEASNDLAIALLEDGQIQKCISLLISHLDGLPAESEHRFLLLSNLARAYFTQGNYQKALPLLEDVISHFTRVIGSDANEADKYNAIHYCVGAYIFLIPTKAQLSNSYNPIPHYEEALGLSSVIYKGSHHRKTAKLYIALADAQLTTNPKQALKTYNRALRMLQPANEDLVHGQYPEQLVVECTLAKIAIFKNRFNSTQNRLFADSVMLLYDQLFRKEAGVRSELLSSASRYNHVEQFYKIGKNAVEFSHSQYQLFGCNGCLIKTLQYATYAKGILMTESLIQSTLLSDKTDSLLSELIEIESVLADLRFSTDDNKHELFELNLEKKARLKETLRLKSPQLYKQWSGQFEFDIQKIQAKLIDENSRLLTVFDAGQVFYFFMADGHILRSDTTHANARSILLLKQFKDHLLNPALPARDYQTTAFALYQKMGKLIGKGTKRLIVVPDGRVSHLPFELLLCDTLTNPDYRNLYYALRDINFRYLPTVNLLVHGLSQNTYSQTQLLVEPDFSCNTSLSPLPEVEMAKQGTSLKGNEAMANAFLAWSGKAQMVHIASHGFANSQSLNETWIALSSPDSCEHEKLHFDQIQSKRFLCDLLVLQSCQSANGYVLSGEGTLSIANAFLQAGSSSIIASMWDANPAVSSQILKRFYASHKAVSLSEQLRNAKLNFLNNQGLDGYSAHPYFWGGFNIYGSDVMNGEVEGGLTSSVIMLCTALFFLGFMVWFLRNRFR